MHASIDVIFALSMKLKVDVTLFKSYKNEFATMQKKKNVTNLHVRAHLLQNCIASRLLHSHR